MRKHNKTWKSVIRLFHFQTPLPRFHSCRTTWAPLQRLSPSCWRVNALSSSEWFCDLLKANPRPVTQNRKERLLCAVCARITGNTEILEHYNTGKLKQWTTEKLGTLALLWMEIGKSIKKQKNTGSLKQWKHRNS